MQLCADPEVIPKKLIKETSRALDGRAGGYKYIPSASLLCIHCALL